MDKSKEMVVVSVRIRKDIKEEMQDICEELGTSMAGAIQMFATAVVRERGIPFDLKLDHQKPDIKYGSVKLGEEPDHD